MNISLAKKYKRSFLHGFSSLNGIKTDGPQLIQRGEGIYVFDAEGRRYLEANSGLWNAVLGFNDRDVIDAAIRQFEEISPYHTFFGRSSEPAIELAALLSNCCPLSGGRVFFTNSGSEANDTAIKIAWMVQRSRGEKNRRKILARQGGYHGTSVMGANLTGRSYNRVFGMPFGDVRFTDCPHFWRYGLDSETEDMFLDRIAGNLIRLIESEGPETIAAMIAEPVLGAGGVVVPPKGYFGRIKEVLDHFGILLIADEVITGLGRTGELWGSQAFSINPDIITTSKCITAGYFPLGAVLPSAEITTELDKASAELDEFPHGFTTAGSPVGCAVGLVVVDKIVNGGVLEHVGRIAPYFENRLRDFEEHPHVGEVRGVGLMGAIEVVKDKSQKAEFDPDLEVADKLAKAGCKEGIMIRPIGNAVIFAPPFIIEPHQIDELFDAFGTAFEQVLAQVA
jgi:adenosylmethionine-8-amino-7-oxononanoate aminotransferase